MEDIDVIVIGAGIAGLGAARKLAAQRKRVLMLEARDRLGGRILTEHPAGWPSPIELGAEFIHGGNAALTAALRAAGIGRRGAPLRHWLAEEGRLSAASDAFDRIDAQMRKIGPGTRGSFADWIRRNRSQISQPDQTLLEGFVQGFEGAPPQRMSAHSLYLAARAGEGAQQRPARGGYGRLVTRLADALPEDRVQIRLGEAAATVVWRAGQVRVKTVSGRSWGARSALVTLPLGVLKIARGPGALRFDPPLRQRDRLLRRLESGHTIRIVLRLRADAWRRGPIPAELRARSGAGFGFIHSALRDFPVWWSQAPDPVLVGWMGGPAAAAIGGETPRRIYQRSLASLAQLLRLKPAALERIVLDYRVHDWSADPFTRGSYSFSVANAEDAPRRLAQSVGDTLFFAGEATADVLELGTVHGALASGERAAKEILRAQR